MKRSLFIPHWFDEVCSRVNDLERALAGKFGVANHRRSLEDARDSLHEMTRRFEDDGEAENDESTYLTLFDALSFLTLALSQHPVNRGCVLDACELLRDLRNKACPY